MSNKYLVMYISIIISMFALLLVFGFYYTKNYEKFNMINTVKTSAKKYIKDENIDIKENNIISTKVLQEHNLLDELKIKDDVYSCVVEVNTIVFIKTYKVKCEVSI